MLVWAALNFLLCMADIVNLYCSKNSLLHLQGWSGDTAHQNYFRLFYRPWGQKKKIHCFFYLMTQTWPLLLTWSPALCYRLWLCLKRFLVVTLRDITGMWWVEVRGTHKYSLIHRIMSHCEDILSTEMPIVLSFTNPNLYLTLFNRTFCVLAWSTY